LNSRPTTPFSSQEMQLTEIKRDDMVWWLPGLFCFSLPKPAPARSIKRIILYTLCNFHTRGCRPPARLWFMFKRFLGQIKSGRSISGLRLQKISVWFVRNWIVEGVFFRSYAARRFRVSRNCSHMWIIKGWCSSLCAQTRRTLDAAAAAQLVHIRTWWDYHRVTSSRKIEKKKKKEKKVSIRYSILLTTFSRLPCIEFPDASGGDRK
jgi:hypothetical protein